MTNDTLERLCKDEVISSYLPDWIEENHTTPQARQSLPQLNVEPGASKYKSRAFQLLFQSAWCLVVNF
jgi:hypothetical protein